jgi:DNA polymerase-3 subunit beta
MGDERDKGNRKAGCDCGDRKAKSPTEGQRFRTNYYQLLRLKMILTLSKEALLSAMIFQAKKDVRYYLNGICFAPDKKLYATDGHRAFIGEHETEGLKERVIVAIKGPKFSKFEKAEIDTESGVIKYIDNVKRQVALGLCEVVDGKFPDIDRVVPKDNQPVTSIGFNAGYLADIEKAAKLYSPKFCGICIKPNGTLNSSIIEFAGAFGKASVVIMPMRI